MHNDNQNRIDAYLRGEMSGEQRADFENDLKADSNLNDEYLQTKAIADALADRAEKLRRMAEWDAQEQMGARLARRLSLRRWALGIGAAACIAVGFFALRPLLFPRYSHSVPSGINTEAGKIYRSGSNPSNEVRSLMAAERYYKALTVCDSLICDIDSEIAAIVAFDSISERDSYRLQQRELERYDLEWQRINILIVLDKRQEAKKALIDFVLKDGEYQTQAEELLSELSD